MRGCSTGTEHCPSCTQVLGGLVAITMYFKHRARRDGLTPASDDYHKLTEPHN